MKVKYTIEWADNGEDRGSLETEYTSIIPARKRLAELRKWYRGRDKGYTFGLNKTVTTVVEKKS